MTCLLLSLAVLATAPTGLADVVNMDKAQALPAKAREVLSRDSFVVVEGRERHFFSLYDRNAYEKVPSFISVDVTLHVFHARFDEALAQVELQKAAPALEAFAKLQLARALSGWPDAGAPPGSARELAEVHAIALRLIDPTVKLDPRVARVAEAAAQRIEALSNEGGSIGVCEGLELSLFKPRGHYDRPALRPYFRAVTFYSQCSVTIAGATALVAVNLTRLVDGPAAEQLAMVRHLQEFIAGPADDPGVTELAPLVVALPPWPAPLPSKTLAELVQRTGELARPRVASLQRGPTFRILGGSATADAVLLSATAAVPGRDVPSVLDLLTALGSAEARAALAPSKQLSALLTAPLPASGGFAGRWLEVLRSLVTPPTRGPAFSASATWRRHSLVSAAGSWAELKHDTLLYVKQPMVMREGGHEAELPASKVGGYVEPRPEVYRQLLALSKELDGLAGEPSTDLAQFLEFLISVSELELAEQPFPRAVDERLRVIGAELEPLSRSHGDRSPPEALVADVCTVVNPDGTSTVLHAATGEVDELWVVVRRGSRRVLMRGGAFSYYEFASSERLNDDEWLERLAAHPQRPPWATPGVTLPLPSRRRD